MLKIRSLQKEKIRNDKLMKIIKYIIQLKTTL